MATVNLSWAARPESEKVSEYRVYEELPSGGRVIVRTVFAQNFVTPPTSAVLVDVPQGPHKYFIAAVGPLGEGIASPPVSTTVYPPFGTPGVVANFAVNVSPNP